LTSSWFFLSTFYQTVL